ncbi:hypothetical protein 2 [Wuchang romanomermis nematode virus 2]|uniref:Uncharacterized protein n=1 Tax=Wuchang romanomermis nematode virus 2 TaxID=2773460 RepID=A0A1L3KN03_9MONO|nr:hypothetical protein 2 [Wuchang romanomermis nematode virus 2]APG78780.1 hypothetical protein 2 [Wuchang romanomermis nematode virus 2]
MSEENLNEMPNGAEAAMKANNLIRMTRNQSMAADLLEQQYRGELDPILETPTEYEDKVDVSLQALVAINGKLADVLNGLQMVTTSTQLIMENIPDVKDGNQMKETVLTDLKAHMSQEIVALYARLSKEIADMKQAFIGELQKIRTEIQALKGQKSMASLSLQPVSQPMVATTSSAVMPTEKRKIDMREYSEILSAFRNYEGSDANKQAIQAAILRRDLVAARAIMNG